MFIVTWLFDKLGYMPKIDMQVGKVKSWPFPVVEVTSLSEEPKRKVKKTRALPSKATLAKTARAKKVK
jgi:hypothetical protein